MNSWSYFKTLMNSNQGNFEMNSLEEGKSNFLKMVSSFKSEDDAIVFLNWIKNEALEKLLSNLQLAGMRNRFYSNRTRNLATDDIKTENDDVSISKSFSLETDDKDNSDNFELEPDEIKTFLSHQEPDIYSKKDEEPDTYSEKVIPAPIRMQVQLESTLPVSTMKRQGKAKMKQVHDTALSSIEY